MKFTTLLLIATASAVKLQNTPQNQQDYWARENAIQAGIVADAAAVKAAAAKVAAEAAAAKEVVAAKAEVKAEHKAVWDNVKDQTAQNMHPETLRNIPTMGGDIKERDYASSASNISDNTHTGEHWDAKKRGAVIRQYRKELDSCNISGTGKCPHATLGTNAKY